MNSASLSFHLPEDINGIAYHKMVSTMELDSKKRGVNDRNLLRIWLKMEYIASEGKITMGNSSKAPGF